MGVPQITIETITPATAEQMLQGNTNNRTAKKTRIARYSADMKAGKWMLTGEAIKFNGVRLLDGQNRLMACVDASSPFTTVVMRGVDEGAMDVMDTGAPRSVGDALRLRGTGNRNQVAASARLILMWRAGRIADPNGAQPFTTPRQQIEFVEEHDELLQSAANVAWACARVPGLINTATGAAYTEIALGGCEWGAIEFFTAVNNGEGLNAGDPRLVLRNWAAGIGRERREASTHLHAEVTAWNAYVQGRPIKLIRQWMKTTPFPKVVMP